MTRSLLALGALVFIAVVAQGQAFAQTPPAAVAPLKIPAALPKDVAFGRFIAQIRGHLLTGSELVRERNWGEAARHFGFPREEIYGVIREDLPAYKTPHFDGSLKDLVRAVKARSLKRYQKALQNVEHALSMADANLKTRQPNWPRFVAQVAIALLKVAPDEYDDAVDKDRIVRPVGYQTARGFILQADRMIESVAVDLSLNNASALADIRSGFAQLKQGFVTVKSPKQPVLNNSDAAAIVARVALAAEKIN